ncbi:MAG: hypothetical protein J6M39_02205 [Lachnospiraceae bacterium]|nr:hypothetical protein [Lachnospiraceae bacterium]
MKKFKSFKQKFKSYCLLFFVIIYCFSTFSYVGWYREGDKMTYLTSDGYKVANAWRESDGMKFYLDENGYVLYDKVFWYNGKIYYVGPNGAKVTNSFVEVTSDMIIGDEIAPGYFYFSEDGSAYIKNGSNFLKSINGKKYAFDELGHIVADCWLNKDGDLIESNNEIITDGIYHIKPDGTIHQNEWYDYTSDPGSDYGMEESNTMASSYDDLSNLWMYFNSKGEKVYSSGDSYKKVTLNGKEYTFDNNGILVMGFQKSRSELDTHQASNPTITDRIKFYDKYEGYLVKNKWVYDATPEAFSESDYYDGKDYWYYIDDSGSLVKNRIKTIGNNKYSFDGFGRLRKGFILVDGITFYGAEYKSEDLTREDFIFSILDGGRLYGSDLLDLRYFIEDEAGENEGKMATGNIEIELADGKYEFNFRDSGVAYGNKNELKFFKNTYYKNGIKFIPWEDTRYGIVKVSDTEYRVINSSGKLVTGRKKVIKDDYENYIIILNDKLAAYIVQPSRKVKLRWKTFNNITGYYYYDMDYEKKRYTGLAVASGTTCPTADEISDIPNDMKVNFR